MSSADRVLAVAASQLGVCESPAGSNRVKYNAWYGVNGIPWCATFVSWVLDRSGLTDLHGVQNAVGAAYCPYIESHFRQQGRWQSAPERGAIVLFDWAGDGSADHIGIVESVGAGDAFTTIEGNTSASDDSNGGQVQRRTRYLHQVRGFGLPRYEGSAGEADLDRLSYEELGEPQLYLASPRMNGVIVRHVQKRLVALGFSIGSSGIDGVFGIETERAVKSFQGSRGLEVDGWVGKATWQALFS